MGRTISCILLYCVFFGTISLHAQPINRMLLVKRHAVVVTSPDSLSSLTVGNGKFAFTVDITGLQSFPEYYSKGVPLGTESEWGWHSFPNTSNFKFESTLKRYHINGRDISYAVQWNEPAANKQASDWFRQNPHRLQLGNIGLVITKEDGSIATINDIKNIHQLLDLWSGKILSNFTVENIPVSVTTICHPQQDVIAAIVESTLIRSGRLKVFIRFPYPTGDWADVGTNWNEEDKHSSKLIKSNSGAVIHRVLDSTQYWVEMGCSSNASISEKSKHYFEITSTGVGQLEFVARFASARSSTSLPSFRETNSASMAEWKKYWLSGGAIDFSGSKDPRAFELERRIILSQYLMRAQEAGSYPPQETGLTYNSWYGKPHLEMHWWHSLHYALWGRIELLEKSLDWYAKVFDKAKQIAARQEFDGVRWQKMTDNQGDESPSSVGAFLIWQQPHIIYFAELCYRQHKDAATLNRYKNLVFATADFVASFPYYEKEKDRYILGKGLIPAQERYKPEETFNPTFELAYWKFALSIAQEWRKRLHLPIEKKWDAVLKKLSRPAIQSNVYLAAESAPDSYTNESYKTDHPSVLGAFGFLPQTGMIDTTIMRNTFDLIWKTWKWDDTWGWDFPLTAMTAARLGLKEKAIDALLMDMHTNTYLVNGHNYQDQRLRIYMPGNGGLLTAIAMMCAGWDGSSEKKPGIPKRKDWVVRWEGLKKMP